MIALGLLIGAALTAMGLLHVIGNGGWTTAIGVGRLVKHQRAGVDR